MTQNTRGKLTPEQWAQIRHERETTGDSFRTLAARHGVSDVAIGKRAKAEGWGANGKKAAPNKAQSAKVSKGGAKQTANRGRTANRKRKPEPIEQLQELPEELEAVAVPIDQAETISYEQEEAAGVDPHALTLSRIRTLSLEGGMGDSELFSVRVQNGKSTKYHPDFAELAYKHCLLGATPEQVASLLRVTEQTIYNWMDRHPEFAIAMEEGRGIADMNVSLSLYKKATGFTHKAVKVFQFQGQPVVVPYTEVVPPDTDAAKFWLKNRQPQQWKEKVEVEERATIALVDKEQLDEVYRSALEHAAEVERSLQGRAERLGLILEHEDDLGE